MPLNETEVKTRLGLILQGVLSEGILQAGYTAVQDYQYEPTCEKPDFLIPDEKRPAYMVEVHQTEARDSFRMKILRAFTAVTEAKAHYGDQIISVNVLFGDPDHELPASNVRALCSVFDVNVVPRKDATDKAAVVRLESAAATVAADEDYTKKTLQAIKDVITAHPKGVKTLADLMKHRLASAKARPELFPIWRAERERVSKLGPPPKAQAPTYYKRQMLRSMFVNDAEFDVMFVNGDPQHWATPLKEQLVRVKLATISEEIDGDLFHLDSEFTAFLVDRKSKGLRQLCKAALEASPEMRWFFEDIRNRDRRIQMAQHYVLAHKSNTLQGALEVNLLNDQYEGIEHTRAWLIDCISRSLDVSQNQISRRIFTNGVNAGRLGDPISHIAPKTARFRGLGVEAKRSYVSDVLASVVRVMTDLNISKVDLDPLAIEEKLLRLRLDGAIKLRKLDPLLLVVGDVCSELGLQVRKVTVESAIGDLSNARSVGRFEMYAVSSDSKTALLNAVAVHEQNGDHKSKEWGARRLATLYRYKDGKVRGSEFGDGIFILDGEWEDKDVARLFRSGWNHICRLDDLEARLKHVFGLKGKLKGAKRKRPLVGLESDDEYV